MIPVQAINDWPRSLITLALGFAAVVVVTLGVAGVLVPTAPEEAGGRSRDDEADMLAIGGDLVVTGDRTGTVAIRLPGPSWIPRPAMPEGERFRLSGEGLRIALEPNPARIVQISYDGLEFFPDQSACVFTPRQMAMEAEIGMVELHCDELRDVRGNGVIGLSGEIGLPTVLLVERTVPDSGGSVTVGEEVWEFDEVTAFISDTAGDTMQYSIYSFAGFDVRSLEFGVLAGRMRLISVERDGTSARVPAETCDVSRKELGKYVRTLVVELQVRCRGVDVPGLGLVPMEGTVIVDETPFLEPRGR